MTPSYLSYFFHLSQPPTPPPESTFENLPYHLAWKEVTEQSVIHYVIPKYLRLRDSFRVWISGTSPLPTEWKTEIFLKKIFDIWKGFEKNLPPDQYVLAFGGEKTRFSTSKIVMAIFHFENGTTDPDRRPGDPYFEFINIAPYALRALSTLPEEGPAAPPQTG